MTAFRPIVVPPPGRLSITTGWPSRDDRTGAIILAIMSLGDPGV
jgi:hypothetical protein